MNSNAATVRRLILRLLVHCDALRLNPVSYLRAAVWRAFGRRLRARNQFAALLGRSRHAYALWIASIEPQATSDLVLQPRSTEIPIIPVILNSADETSIRKTLDSIAGADGAFRPIVVGGSTIADALHVTSLSQLAPLVSADGTWVCLIEAGDLLAPAALRIYSGAAAQSPDKWVIYADDDLIASGARQQPHFKSAWNAELFENHDFITGACIIRVTREMVCQLSDGGGARQVLAEALRRDTPLHLPAVLHHRRWRPPISIPPKPPSVLKGSAPAVAVIVPTRNHLSLLRTCIDGVRATAYSPIELIVVNNDSDDIGTLRYLESLAAQGVTVLDLAGPFNFSALNNAAAAASRSDLLCFLNNDIEVTDPDWLALLAPHAVREDIGAVGARLLYPDGSVQHAGVVTGVGGGAGHAHRFMREADAGYFSRDRLPQRVSAVTAACLLVEKGKFLAVGGFDEKDFPVAFNDVDLCLKLNARGWQSFYEPRATLIHHESKSRGKDSSRTNRTRFAGELAALKRRWGTDRVRDPYHHPHLSPFCEQFQIGL